ncbi:DUF3784 domain-containing protein [Haloimpatiens sp. FM7330]|uniref:DUF3784 domain-containing protein n=1 Tax=Haloimpatiens sp. FM7330 TaxID=3298610 RepID=UPI00362E63C3
MKPADLTGIFVVAFLAGGILTFLGAIIKYFNAGDIINFFDEKKHDKDKVSRIVGRDLLIIGVSVIISAVISIFIDEKYYNFMMVSQVFIIIFGLVLTNYQFFKCCKK